MSFFLPARRVMGLLGMVSACGFAVYAADESAVLEMEELLVTATRHEVPAAKTPLALTAVSESAMQEGALTALDDLTGLTPNFRFYSAGSRRTGLLFIRGLGSSGPNQPAVGVFVDDIYFGRTGLADMDLFDLERVEVLRGPQGTLYGQNTQGGVVHLITRSPPAQWEGFAGHTWGEYGLSRTTARVGGPLHDRVFFSLSGLHYTRDGFSRNVYLGRDADPIDRQAGRLLLQWTGVEGWDLLFTAYADRDRDGGYAMTTLAGAKSAPHRVAYDQPARHERDMSLYHLRAVRSFPAFDFVSISAYTDWRNRETYDRDFTPADLFVIDDRERMHALSQELRFLSPAGEAPWRWVAGLYAYGSDNREDEALRYGRDAPAMGAPAGLEERSRITREERTAAAFGRLTRSFGEAWEWTGGLRLEHTRLAADGMRGQGMDGQPVSGRTLDRSLVYDEWMPEVSLAYVPDPWMLYGRVARGFRAGGFNTHPGTAESYGSEHAWNFEAGYKTALLERRLSAAVTLFHLLVEDRQLLRFDPGGAGFFIDNTGRAESSGIELELSGRPAKGLTLDLAAGWNETRIRERRNDMEGPSHKGNRLPFAPRATARAGLQHRFNIAGDRSFFSRLDYHVVGTTAWDEANLVQTDPYQLVHLRLGIESPRAGFFVFARNLFEENYQEAVYVFPGAEALAFPGAPRILGASVEMRF